MNQNSEDLFENTNKYIKSKSKEDNIKNELIFQKALDFHQKGNIEEAKKYYTYLIKKETIDQRALLNLGAIFHQSREFDKAIKFYNFSISCLTSSLNRFSEITSLSFPYGWFSESLFSSLTTSF